MQRLTSTIVLLLVTTSIFSQSDPFSQPAIQRFGLEEGLPHRSNLSSIYDRDSIIWLSTEASICRFDGYEIITFPNLRQRLCGRLTRNEDSLIYSIIPGFPDSLEFLDPVRLVSGGYRLSQGLRGAYAGAVRRDGEPLYFAQGGFIYRYRVGESPEAIHELGSEVNPQDRLLHAAADAYIIYRHQTGELEEITPDGKSLRTKLPASGENITFHASRNGDLWIGTDQGLYRKLSYTSRLESGPELPTGKAVNSIFEDRLGNMIFGHLQAHLLRYKGLILYNEDNVIDLQWLVDLDDRIHQVNGTDFFQEMNVGTHGGFVRITFPNSQKSPFRRYLYSPEVRPGGFGHVMRGFTADDEGNVYTNKDTRSPLWFRVNAGTLDLDTLVMRDNAGQVVDNFGCGTNMLNYRGDIFGTSCTIGGADTAHVYRYRPADNSWKRWALPELNQRIRWIMTVPYRDDLLVITEGKRGKKGGLYYFLPATGAFTVIHPAGPKYFIEGYTKQAAIDTSRKVIWIGSTGGLYRYETRTDSLSRYTYADEGDTEISHVHLRPDGSLLLGTFQKGLLRFFPEEEKFKKVGGIPSDDNAFTQSSDFLPLPSNDVASFAVTPEKYLLIPTFNGLSLHGHAEGPGSVFTSMDGLPSNEFNTPSLFYHEPEQRWYAGGVNGFVSFKIKDLIRAPSPYAPIILRTRYLDEETGFEQSKSLINNRNAPLIIPPSVAFFSLEYTIPDYSKRRPLKYQTQLVGYDPGWRKPTQSPSVRYTRLPPGKYLFHLKAIDGEDRITSTIKELQIIVLKPWYNTLWFYGLCLLGAALSLWFFILNREKRLQKDYQAKRQLQQVELRALRQQINPHFISNSMNAIRDFIFLESPRQAAGYITDFSRLMRLFLESSRNRFTSVKDELDLLERYIRLEQLRYHGKFEYSFSVDDSIAKEMDEVPSLLLQPIVENAINHGLCHLDRGGILTVDIALDPEDEDTIVCTITDNGVGRKVAERLASQSPEHVSRATQILEDRQRLLDADGIIKVDISTDDLYPELEYTGTRVTVRIEPVEAKVR